MTVPTREEAARLLLSLDPPDWHVRHSRAVAEVAGWLALRVNRRGSGRAGDAVRRDLVEAAALLHDVDKALPRMARPPGPHGESGAAWLAEHGYGELAEGVRFHPVTWLVDEARAAAVRGASLEGKLVAYADKRAGQRLESMAERFGGWARRHPHGWRPDVVTAAWRHARALEDEVCDLAGCRPEEVRRLRWSRRVMAGIER